MTEDVRLDIEVEDLARLSPELKKTPENAALGLSERVDRP